MVHTIATWTQPKAPEAGRHIQPVYLRGCSVRPSLPEARPKTSSRAMVPPKGSQCSTSGLRWTTRYRAGACHSCVPVLFLHLCACAQGIPAHLRMDLRLTEPCYRLLAPRRSARTGDIKMAVAMQKLENAESDRMRAGVPEVANSPNSAAQNVIPMYELMSWGA